MIRVPQGQRAVLTATFTDGGVPADLQDVPSVTVTREDGVLVATGLADHPSTGHYEFALDPDPATTTLDILTATWSGTRDGALQTLLVDEIHIVGAHYFTIADLRTLDPLDDTDRFPDATLQAIRDLVAFDLERTCAVAFTPSYGRDVLLGSGTPRLSLSHRLPRALVSITVDDNDFDLVTNRVLLRSAGVLEKASGVWPERSLIEVRYRHGHHATPPRVARAAMILAREYAYQSERGNTPDRATSLDTEAGSFRLVTAGVGGALYGLPEVNAVVQEYGI